MSIERIKKLLGMTKANGCTEAEAMSAAAKAAKLMAEMGLRRGDIEMDEERVSVRVGVGAVRARLWSVIGACTNSSPILVEGASAKSLAFVGREPGPEIAAYLHQVTDRALDHELGLFRSTTWYKRRRTLKAKRAATADFTLAMVRRLSQRLVAMFEPSISDTALEEAKAERDARFPSSRKVSMREVQSSYWQAEHSGRQAADDVTLAHGVGGGAPLPALGSGQ